jgi:hypothetical protein
MKSYESSKVHLIDYIFAGFGAASNLLDNFGYDPRNKSNLLENSFPLFSARKLGKIKQKV